MRWKGFTEAFANIENSSVENSPRKNQPPWTFSSIFDEVPPYNFKQQGPSFLTEEGGSVGLALSNDGVFHNLGWNCA